MIKAKCYDKIKSMSTIMEPETNTLALSCKPCNGMWGIKLSSNKMS